MFLLEFLGLILTLYKTMCLVGEFEEANANADMGMQVQYFSSRWKAPVAGLYKLNTDPAFQGQWLGIGGILRDEGAAVVVFCSKENGKVDVGVGEAIAMRSSLKIAMEAGFRNFILETDNIKLFHHLKKGSISPCSFGNLVRDILMLARSCQSCVFLLLEGRVILLQERNASLHFSSLPFPPFLDS